MSARVVRRSRQRGVAVITALLLTTLAITIVASLFWQQQVQVRSIENQRLQLQKQWILRGALDWARLILREDAKYSSVDHLGEPWAVSLKETRLDQYVDSVRADTAVGDAALSGGIIDAQSRFNLTNLSAGGNINQGEVDIFARLLTNLRLNPGLAAAAAELMASSQSKQVETAGGGMSVAAPRPMSIAQIEDLLAVPGFTPEILAKLKDFIAVLPVATPVNLNTAPPEVLAAKIETLSLSDATALVKLRERAYFRNLGDFSQHVPGKLVPPSAGEVSFSSGYFFVDGKVRLNQAALGVRALVERNGVNTKVIWIRES
jgi:general secretion pathway protein K